MAWPYGTQYRRERDALLAVPRACELRLVCGGAVADSADHDPPLALHDHRPGSGCCRLRPACLACQHRQARLIQTKRWRASRPTPAPTRSW